MKSSEDESREAPESPRAIVAGHGDFPGGIVSAVDQISGRGNMFVAVTNRDFSGESLQSHITETIESAGIKVIFTDLPGGSATLAVRRIMRSNPELVLVTGTNLATLLEFVFHADLDAPAAARSAAEKGRAALAAVGGA
jgi:PTS system N-acetylgalactosamine-specific IIA component